MTGPVDLVAVQQDDLLLDRLGQGLGLRRDDDDVAALLATWRADLADDSLDAAEPGFVPALPPLEVPPAGTRRRYARPVVVGLVLAGVVASAGGVAAAAAQATPGSTLWPLTKVVAPEHAQSAQARNDVEKELKTARSQARHGHIGAAKQSLHKAEVRISQVAPDDNQARLRAELEQVKAATVGDSTTSPSTQASASPDTTASPSGSTESAPPPVSSATPSPEVSSTAAASPGSAHVKKAAAPGQPRR